MNETTLKKALIQMRMELHRQEIRHETLLVMKPLQQVRHFGERWQKAKPWIGMASALVPVAIAVFRGRASGKKS